MTGEAESPKGMSIEGPYARERNRVEGMTDADRQWRKQYLKDQVLSHNEPRLIPESEQYNPIRRFYRFPLNFIFKKLEPTLVSFSYSECMKPNNWSDDNKASNY